MSEPLKPCPHCGGNSMCHDSLWPSDCFIMCNRCAANGPRSCSPEEAAAAWNTRADGWISVEDRLPENAGYYLAAPYHESIGGIAIQYFDPSRDDVKEFDSHVTHWQPLPALPKAVQK